MRGCSSTGVAVVSSSLAADRDEEHALVLASDKRIQAAKNAEISTRTGQTIFTGQRDIFNAGSISPRSVAKKVYIYTLDQANMHPGDSRGKEIMPFSTKLNEKMCTYASKMCEMLKDGIV